MLRTFGASGGSFPRLEEDGLNRGERRPCQVQGVGIGQGVEQCQKAWSAMSCTGAIMSRDVPGDLRIESVDLSVEGCQATEVLNAEPGELGADGRELGLLGRKQLRQLGEKASWLARCPSSGVIRTRPSGVRS
jgi:hypothetical protein